MPAIRTFVDRLLLLEILLVLVLLGLAIAWYWRPAAAGPLDPQWWQWLTLGLFFFGAVGLHTWRHRQRRYGGLHQTIREQLVESEERV